MEAQTLEAVQTTLPGFDQEKMQGFASFITENPNDVLLTLEGRTIWEGFGGSSLGKIGPWQLAGQLIDKSSRDFSIQFGAWKEVEETIGIPGARDRVEPVEAALASMCACVTWAICINSALEGVTFDQLEVKAVADVDPRVLFGVLPIEAAGSCLQKVQLSVEVSGEDLSPEDKVRIEEMVHRSPVHALIKHSNDIYTTVNVNS